MTKRNLTKAIISLLLLFPFYQSFAQKEVDFQINLTEGACFEVQTAMSSQGTASVGNETQDNNMESSATTRYRVVKKTADYYQLNFMYTDWRSIMKMGMKEVVTDSKNTDMLNFLAPATQVAMMMNKPFSAELSPKGMVLSIGKNKEIEKEFKKKTKKLSLPLHQQVYMMVDALTAEESLKNEVESWAAYIPASAVKIGDKWSVEKDSTLTHYTFAGETDSTYIIHGVGSGEDTKVNTVQGMTMIIHNEQEFTVSIEFDKHTFLPKIIKKEVDMLTKVEIEDYPDFATDPSPSQVTFTLKINSCN